MEYIERTVSFLTKSLKGHDAKLFTRGPAFSNFPTQTLTVTSPDGGASGSLMGLDHVQDGKNLIPTIHWPLDSSIPSASVAEYLVVVEDADVPLLTPVMHGGFYSIPASRTTISPEDIVSAADGATQKGNSLRGGFRYAKTLTGDIYQGPRPLKGHGEHRYFYQVVALSEPLDLKEMSPHPKKAELALACQGKVLGWGEWVGVSVRE